MLSYRSFSVLALALTTVVPVSLTLAGYWFGRIEWVKNNFEVVVLAIIVISLLPVVIEFFMGWRRSRQMRLTMADHARENRE